MTSFGRDWLREWMLDPAALYLNHGTVGATPRRVLSAQQQIRDAMERHPSRYLLREVVNLVGSPSGPRSRMREAADAIAGFVGCRGDDLVFVDNATSGANAVLRSFHLQKGDEIIVTDHGYGGVTLAVQFAAREAGATVRVVSVPYPRFDADEFVRRVQQAITPRTRLAVIDHVTSESALILPLAEVAAACRRHGVAVLGDGAHAPGAIPVDIAALGVDWYTANLHKWAWAPRSCGVLWTAPERQAGLHPVVISWGLDRGYVHEFDWVGTRDPSTWLAAPGALDYMRELGVTDVQRWNHDLAWEAGQRLCRAWGTDLGVAESCTGTMITVPVPPRLGTTREDALKLRDALLFEDDIEIQVHAWGSQLWTRVSAQIYNDVADIERLERAVLRRA